LGSLSTTLATGGSTTDAVASGVVSSVAVEENAGTRANPTNTIQQLRTDNYYRLTREYEQLTGKRYPTITGPNYQPSQEAINSLQREIEQIGRENNVASIPSIGSIPNTQLNTNINNTMAEIMRGESGRPFRNNENHLPLMDSNGNPITYREYNVEAIFSGRDNNVHRIVVGSNGNYYYTNTHYGTNYNAGPGIPFYNSGRLPQNVTNTIFGGQK